MKSILICLMFMICFITAGYSQHSAKSHKPQQQLKIGDKIPDLMITEFLDQSHPGLKLSELYKKGGLIINFWATWCSPCLQELQILNGLAEKYRSKLGVLSVEYEDPDLVSKFLKVHPEIPVSNLNLIAGDTLLVEYLRHRSLPYNVWIDTNGIIRNITHGDEINEKNINSFIDGLPIKVVQVHERMDFSYSKPFHYKDSAFLYRSILTGNTSGIPSGFFPMSNSPFSHKWMIYRIYCYNETISDLYKLALSKMATASAADYFNRIQFHTKDSIKYFSPMLNSAFYKNSKYDSRAEWALDHTFCYDLTLPNPIEASLAFDHMLNDLQRTFNLTIKVEKQLRNCTIITLSDKAKLQSFKPSTAASSGYEHTKSSLLLQSNKIAYLFDFLNEHYKPEASAIPLDPPYINETGIEFPIDIQINYDKENPTYKEIRDQIAKKYGFSFKLEKRLVPVFVVSDGTK